MVRSIETTQSAAEGIDIVYDGECPFCTAYVRMTRLREAAGTVRLVDARSDDPQAVRMRGDPAVDLDRGMVVAMDGRLYHGAEAMHVLALMTTPTGPFNRLMRRVFASRRWSRIAYPPLVAGRNLTLRLLGRPRIGSARHRGAS